MLGGQPDIELLEPLPYRQFVSLLAASHVILTDSGGIQEEAPSLSKPVLVTREVTERPEGVQAGASLLVGTDCETFCAAVEKLFSDRALYGKMASAPNPYGDGTAARRIALALVSGVLKRRTVYEDRHCHHLV